MSDLKGKRILIFQQRGWGMSIGHFLAKKLQAEGCQLAAWTFKKIAYEFITKQQEVKYDLIINNDEIMGKPKEYLGDNVFSFAEICADLGIHSLWPIIATSRNHVKSYREKYYYSFHQNVPDEEIVAYVQAVYKGIKKVFEEFRPEVIITPNIIAVPHIMLNLYAQRKGVEMIYLTDSKVSGYYIFSYGYLDDRGPFYDRIDDLNQRKAETANRARAKIYIQEFRKKFKRQENTVLLEKEREQQKSLVKIIRHELSPYRQILYWYWHRPKNPFPNFGPHLDWRPPHIILRDHYSYKRYKKFMEHFLYYPLEKVNKFVYFPLQFQPEAPIDVMAPFFSNQIETARQIAMSLPDDYTLVVKEHPDMVGYRTPSYIEKINRTPNVKLIDYRIPSEEVLRRTDMVISPNSTTMVEAAFYYKPVIQLGNLGTTLKLPNVFKHTNLSTLSVKIKELLALDLKNDEYERRLENFVVAVYDVGHRFNYWGVWERGEKGDMDFFWQIWKNEIKNNIKY